jgi:hypothetical protein
MSVSRTNVVESIRGPVMRELPSREMDAPRAAPGRIVIDLNQGWRFRRIEQPGGNHQPLVGDNGHLERAAVELDTWDLVNLPHSVRLEPLCASGGRNFQGVCWYVRAIELDPGWRDRLIHLRAEGAMQVADVWLNGRKLHTHRCGFTPFTIDLTPHLDFAAGASNVLTLRLNNRDDAQVPPGKPQDQLDFTYFGGLYRSVRLEALARLHITDPILANRVGGGGVFVTCPHVSDDSATVRVRTEVHNADAHARDCTVRHELFDESGQLVAAAYAAADIAPGEIDTVEQVVHVARPLLWHPHHPHLYALRTSILDGVSVLDERTERIGIRHIRFDRERGLFINGERFLAIGANRHQDHPYVGYALPDSAHWRDVKKLREAGFTSVRCHYPQSPAFMDACDELGMLTIVSNPGWLPRGRFHLVLRVCPGVGVMEVEDERGAAGLDALRQRARVFETADDAAAPVGVHEDAQAEAVPAVAGEDGERVVRLAVVAIGAAALLDARQRGNVPAEEEPSRRGRLGLRRGPGRRLGDGCGHQAEHDGHGYRGRRASDDAVHELD